MPPVAGAPLAGVAPATLVAIGIGLHNLGEGLAIGSSFAIGERFLPPCFMVHSVTEGSAPPRRRPRGAACSCA